MSPSSSSPQEIQKRFQRFASLRRAQRSLSELAHPSELETSIDRGRELLIALQGLSIRSGAPESTDAAADRAALAEIDRRLDEFAALARSIVDRCSISQLRMKIQPHAADHPEDILGVVDVVLGGDLESEKNLRLLEYLMTLLCSESRDGYVQVSREPQELVPELDRMARVLWGGDDARCVAAERTFSLATSKLVGAEAVGPLRDSMRAVKHELGMRILHPRVLSEVIHYNAVMSNRVAGLVEGSRSLDRLADDLLSSPEAVAAAPTSDSLFDSAGFRRLIAAFAARIAGATSDDEAAMRAAARCDLGRLRPEELEAFESGEQEQSGFLIRAAVTLGLAARADAGIGTELAELEIDLQVLRGLWAPELAREMTAAARKILAEARYTEASRLSEIKARHLALAGPPEQRRARPRERPSPRELALPERKPWLDPHLTRGGIALAGLALALLLWPAGSATRVWDAEELAQLSAHVQSGYVSDAAAARYSDDTWGSARFVGTLEPAWAALGAEQRQAEAVRMVTVLRSRGVWRALLIDDQGRLQLRIHDGAVALLAPGGP